MYTRRRVATGALAALTLGGGCLDFVTGEEALTFEAEPARTDEETASDAGYELEEEESQTVEREFSAAGQTRTVEATNEIATYEKTMRIPVVGEAKLGVFAVISSPAVEVAGKTFNPIGDYDHDELVEMLTSNYEGLSDPEKVDERSATVLGSDETVSKYEATATFEGQEVDVFVHVAKARDDDFVVPLGVYPRDADEEENVVSMMEAIEHPA
ncbi:DUF6517 family protein [Halegenticoccus tardaugens]|uniref:DUF6517 family protein n=1 Tax=Halegenticoccus tardaugens TaxID=2071624 RepID=UPI00100B3E02|nr:DUF6517 family protein [Halegenticoccus tardaugens]